MDLIEKQCLLDQKPQFIKTIMDTTLKDLSELNIKPGDLILTNSKLGMFKEYFSTTNRFFLYSNFELTVDSDVFIVLAKKNFINEANNKRSKFSCCYLVTNGKHIGWVQPVCCFGRILSRIIKNP